MAKDGLTKPELNLILMCDNSYSMAGTRIGQLNHAIPEMKQRLSEFAEDNGVDLKVRIMLFSDNPIWVVGDETSGMEVQDIVWQDADVVDMTYTEKALREVNKALSKKYLGPHALHPVVILITDGECNGDYNDYLKEIDTMKTKLSGKSGKEKVTRIAIGVDGYNRNQMEAFASEGMVGDQKQKLIFEVDNSANLANVINWTAMSSMYSSVTNDVTEDMPQLPDPEDWSEEE